MSVIVLGSLGQSPGLTTAAVGLAMNWPRAVVLVEADISKPSSVLSGFLQGSVPASTGLNTLAELTAMTGQRLSARTLWPALVRMDQAEQGSPERYLLHGFSNPVAAKGATTLWGELMRVLHELHNGGVDALIDLGRWNGARDRTALVKQADYVAWATRTTLPGIAATAAHYTAATQERASEGRAGYQAVLEFEPSAGAFPTRELSRFLGTSVIGKVPFSPRGADTYSLGRQTSKRGKATKSYDRAMSSLANVLIKQANEAASVLNPEQVS